MSDKGRRRLILVQSVCNLVLGCCVVALALIANAGAGRTERALRQTDEALEIADGWKATAETWCDEWNNLYAVYNPDNPAPIDCDFSK